MWGKDFKKLKIIILGIDVTDILLYSDILKVGIESTEMFKFKVWSLSNVVCFIASNDTW